MRKTENYIEMFRRAEREQIPLELSIELTHRCNFRCRHCYISDFHAPDLLSTERIFELLEELAGMGTLYLSFTGGEAMLRSDWKEIFRRARQLGFQVTLLTNGALIDEAAADELTALDVIVEISYYAVDAGVFEKISRSGNSFDATTRAVHLLKERGVQLQLKMPVMRLNADEVDGVRQFAGELGIDSQSFAKILFADYYHKKYGITDSNPEYRLIPELSDDGEERLCAAAHRFAAISSNGDVMACNIMPGVAGNILEGSFREIWENSPWLKQLRAYRRRDLRVCDTCSAYAFCGRCPAQALLEDGDLLGPSKEACHYAAALKEMGRIP